MTPAAREHVPEHSGQAGSARGEPPPSSWPDLIWPPRMLTADADDLGHSSNWSRSATCLRRSIRPPWPILDGQDPARVRGFVPVACPIRRSTPGTCGHSRLARHPARKAKACRSWRLHRGSPGGLPGHRGSQRAGTPAAVMSGGIHRSGSSGVQFAHWCGSSTACRPARPSTGPSPSARARQWLREAAPKQARRNPGFLPAAGVAEPRLSTGLDGDSAEIPRVSPSHTAGSPNTAETCTGADNQPPVTELRRG
jgi:hypothetical protein